MKHFTVALLMLLTCLLSGAESTDNKPAVQKYGGDNGQWQMPKSAPSLAERNKLLGKYTLSIRGTHSIWNGRILHIQEIRVIHVKDVFPHLRIKATISVPIAWDNQEPIPIEVTLKMRSNPTSGKSEFYGITMRLKLNLSYENKPKTVLFTGSYDSSNRSFLGSFTEKGGVWAAFRATRIKR